MTTALRSVERAGLNAAQAQLLDDVDAIFRRLTVPQIVDEDVSVTVSRAADGGVVLSVILPHHTERDFQIAIEARAREISVTYGHARERFYPLDSYRFPERSWTAVAAMLVEDVLRGRREVYTTFWGRLVARVDVYRYDDEHKELLWTERYVARRRSWRPFVTKVTEVRRVSFLDPLRHA